VYLQNVKDIMLADAAQLSVEVAGAEAAELYDLIMEAAALIRMASMDLMVQNHCRLFSNLISENLSIYCIVI
jgi:hypothetical protein